MLRITRLTDYGIVLLTHFASKAEGSILSARELSTETGIPLPTASKVLKTLAHSDLLETHRGMNGGFHLSRPAAEITVADMISTLEGPISMTECGGHDEGVCDMESLCVVKDKWKKINDAVIQALQGVTLADLTDSEWSPVSLKGDLSAISGRK
tara:strand:- start:33 stop:494 length:462 start_codon:yes stop_codon:yes gene_type:complete